MGKGRSSKPYFRSLMDAAEKARSEAPVINPIKAAQAKAKANGGNTGFKKAGNKPAQTHNKAPGNKALPGKALGKSAGSGRSSANKTNRPLDGEGRPYITLVQFLKTIAAVETGGAGKHAVRAGGIQVNGVEELRPSRKLHAGDQVTVAGNSHTVKL
jgi:ribosome-associated protein YbcJ (S4-like RNA binding protein)